MYRTPDMYQISNTVRLLYVTTDPWLADAIETTAQQDGPRITVRTADSVSTGTAVLDQWSVDCVVCHHDPPACDGLVFLDEIRDTGEDIPFILLTESGEGGVAREAVSRGATDFFQLEPEVDQSELLVNRIRNAVAIRRAAREAKRVTRRFSDLTEHANQILWIFTPNWDEVLYVNSQYETVYDRSIAELDDDPQAFMESIHPADRERVQGAMQRAATGESVEIEFRVDRGPDDHRWARAEAEPIVEDGAVERIVGFSRDITERKLREECHRDNDQLAESVFQSLSDSLFVLGDGAFVKWNAEAQDATGYTDDELRRMEPTDLFAPSDRDRVADAFESAIADGTTTFEAELVTASGASIPYQFTNSRIDNPAGNGHDIVAIGRDVSERKARERELERQNERLEEFASVVSHDLRNPLDVARGQLQLAQLEHDSEHLAAVSRAHERIEQLIETLLTLARHGETALEIEPVRIPDTVTRCRQTVDTADAEVCTTTDCVVRADPSRLQQLFANLLRNAVEHGGDDVRVTVGRNDDGFYVADDGSGIPANKRDRVFESGFSLADGTGFGLRIVREIVETHGWEISVTESEAGGARFDISDVEFESA